MATYPFSIFVYPLSPLPNTTYHVFNESLPIALAVDNFAAARDFEFTLSWELTAPDGSSSSLNFGEYSERHLNLVDNDSVGVYTSRKLLPPGLYSLTWEYTWTTCYTEIREYRKSSGKWGNKYKDEKEVVAEDSTTVTGKYSFMVDSSNGTKIPTADELTSPEAYGPGTLIAEVLAMHEDEENCPVINPDDRNSTTRSPEPTRTIPNDPVPQRATATEVIETHRLSSAASAPARPGNFRLLPFLLSIWPLVLPWLAL